MVSTPTLSAGDRVKLVYPDDPAFHGRTGTVVRRDPREPAWYIVNLDSYPEHELRAYPAGHRRQNWTWVDPGAGEVEVIGYTTSGQVGGGEVGGAIESRRVPRRRWMRLLRDLFRKGA